MLTQPVVNVKLIVRRPNGTRRALNSGPADVIEIVVTTANTHKTLELVNSETGNVRLVDAT